MQSHGHSKSFGQLKVIKEKIQGNLTTSQYLETYDLLLLNAVRPILLNTDYIDSFVIRLMGWQEKNFRRKVSFVNRLEFPFLATVFLLAKNQKDKVEKYKELKLDRGARVQVVKSFHSALALYKEACDLKLSSPPNDPISYCLGVKRRYEEAYRCDKLIEILAESALWLERALEFKQAILEKYIRLCLNTARRDYTSFFQERVPLDDIVQTYTIAASRAIDKCDFTQGALTSHIQTWLYSGRDSLNRSVGGPDSVHSQLEDIDETVNSTYEQELSEKDSEDEIKLLCKLVDPLGVARCYLGIPEILSPPELELLNRHERKPNSSC